ncbi:transglutaminase-like domain-containing protein [Herbivorax sp. ANBcel31]|uniref:transglutaminase-like domain-containing protein n=1 Tax=Herbivorax sp. ANBcel31 TaxID=3069754 RepID=UPI0027B4D3B6|nr:transglutaminase-like domain-containing protein [Herbivorax sp. ANBcel31]MDQ2084831.1 transglutaminase-like domain-containing protein [Herbivorax sp. ANBcel31]
MKDKLKGYKNYILPLLFSIAAAYWAMSSLFGTSIIMTLITISLINSFLFFVCIHTKGKGIKGGMVFVAISIIYIGLVIIGINIFGSKYSVNYILWFISSGTENNTHIMEFYYMTILIASYFFSCTVFYFTSIRFRISSILLISIVPFILQSTKTDGTIEVAFVIFLVLFFLIYIEKNRREGSYGDQKSVFQINKWYLGSAVILVLISVFFSMTVPKPNTIPKLAYLDSIIGEAIDPVNTTVQEVIQSSGDLGIFNPMDYTRNRYVGAATAPLTENVLFEVEAKEPLYLKSRSWDKYENNQWLIENKWLTDGYKLDINVTRLMKLDTIIRFLERLEGVDEKLNKLVDIVTDEGYTLALNKESEAVIYSRYSIGRNFMTSNGITNVKLIDGREVYKNELGFCFLDVEEEPYRNDIYSFNYMSREFSYSSTQFQIMRLLDRDIVKLLLDYGDYILESENVEILRYDDKPNFSIEKKRILDEARKEMNIAYDNFTSLPEQLPKRIYRLAEEIVEGEKSDYDKAVAIEQFFHDSEFVYDLSPPTAANSKDYIDFFIFESKSGICIHYAAAMVVLARAAGLPARYVEGYVADEIDEETGKYVVRQKDAHAFPEIFIAGYGWMTFEPTVSNERTSEFILFLINVREKVKDISSYIWLIFLDTPLWIKLLLIPYLIFMFWVFVRIFIFIRYSVWEDRVFKYGRKEALESIFKKTENILNKIDLGIKKYETPSNYATRVFDEKGIDIYSFVETFNKSKYGGIEPTNEDIKSGLDMFKHIKKYVKRNSGKLKAMFI